MARSQSLLNVLSLVEAAKEELPVEQQFLNDLKASIELQDKKNLRQPRIQDEEILIIKE